MEIADIVVYLKNRSSTSAIKTIFYELWHGVKLNLSHLRIIDSTVYIHVPKKKRTKLDIYASVVKFAFIRILLAIIAIYDLEIHQMNIVTAFLASDLE